MFKIFECPIISVLLERRCYLTDDPFTAYQFCKLFDAKIYDRTNNMYVIVLY